MTAAPRSVAIIGAGPAGLFALDALVRQTPEARIDVFERLPTPFGLIRSGVAPDHQGTKAVVRQFERAFARPNVRLLANVEIGRDLTAADLAAAYDLVFVATGSGQDRRLGIPGEDLPGVYGSIAFIGWLNGHPDHRDLAPEIGERVVIVGAGNVALDVARLLAKSAEELAGSDLCAHAQSIVERARHIEVVGRSDLGGVRFDLAELQALGRLARARVHWRPGDAACLDRRPPADALACVLEDLAAPGGSDRPVRLDFQFGLTPLAVLGEGRVSGVRFADRNGDELDVAADTVITAIGAQSARVEWPEGFHKVGWASGTVGSIPDSRRQAADTVARALAQHPSSSASGVLPAQLNGHVIDWSGWKAIEGAERARATPPRPREKLTRWDELIAAATREL